MPKDTKDIAKDSVDMPDEVVKKMPRVCVPWMLSGLDDMHSPSHHVAY